MKKICRLLLLAAPAFMAFTGCKDDDEEDTKTYLTGSPSVYCEEYGTFPRYVSPGDKFTVSPSGVTAGDNKDVVVKYYFTNPYTSRRDTVEAGGKYSITIADTLDTFNLSCVAFASNSSDYYTTATSTYYTTVSADLNSGSISGFFRADGDTKVSIRDKYYYTRKIGSTEWMRQNLAYSKDGYGLPYENSPAMLDVFGAYYTWEEAQTACPSGWRLPSEADWVSLCKAAGASEAAEFSNIDGAAAGLMAYTYFNGETMWEYYRGVDINDSTGFTCMPTGYCVITDGVGTFSGYKQYAAYWTSSEKDGQGVYRYIYKDRNIVYAGTASKTGFGACVRCVR